MTEEANIVLNGHVLFINMRTLFGDSFTFGPLALNAEAFFLKDDWVYTHMINLCWLKG